MLSVRLFGTPRLEDDEGVLDGLAAQRHPVALLETGLQRANFGSRLHTDPDLLDLRDHPGFQALVAPPDDG